MCLSGSLRLCPSGKLPNNSDLSNANSLCTWSKTAAGPLPWLHPSPEEGKHLWLKMRRLLEQGGPWETIEPKLPF